MRGTRRSGITGTLHILLVEDEAIIALDEKRTLEAFGYRVTTAKNGEAAIAAALSDGSIGLVLTDIDLGRGMDGTEAARRILAERRLPIVFLSSHSEREMVEKVRGITRYGYVIKNSGTFVLQSSIEMALELFGAHEQLERSRDAFKESEERAEAKLRAILSPDRSIQDLHLKDIVDADRLQRLVDDFTALTGLGMALNDIDGNPVVHSRWHDICANFHRVNAKTEAFCRKSNAELSAAAVPGSFSARRCKNGLWDIATPLMIGDQRMGILSIGQIFFDDEEVDRKAFATQAKKYGFDEDAYLAALDKVPRMSHEQVDTCMRFYTDLSEILGELNYANLKLAGSVEEKANLLRELRHRVKNSLAIVSSILSMSMDAAEGTDAVAPLKEAISRIGAIAAVYEELNQPESLGVVDLSLSLDKLARKIHGAYLADPKRIGLAVELQSIPVELKRAMSLGLILNELLTNAIKYAYPGDGAGEIRVTLRRRDASSAELRVSDDGCGFDADAAIARDSLGLRIADMLAQQLDGQLSFLPGTGTSALVVFRI